jgi:hypothetical protein
MSSPRTKLLCTWPASIPLLAAAWPVCPITGMVPGGWRNYADHKGAIR